VKKLALVVAAMGLLPVLVTSQEARVPPVQPRLYHVWTDAKGITHLEEIKLFANKRVLIPGVTVNFTGVAVPGAGARQHTSPARQLAITVTGELDVVAGDGTKAHLNVGDMTFLEDLTGQGHRTLEKGAASVFLRVPDDFDIKKWAKGE
jgi:hydroxyethylthiazole kinase-like sugar kinase family protein